MAKFKYSALDKEGRELNGIIDSTSERSARKELASQGLTVSRMTEVAVQSEKKSAAVKKHRKPLVGTGVSSESVTIFSRQLATLLKAGLPLLRSLEVISRQEKNPYFKDIIENLADAVRTGNKFSDGLLQHPKVFDKLYVNMARAGEAGGVLDVVLDRLATFQEKAMKTFVTYVFNLLLTWSVWRKKSIMMRRRKKCWNRSRMAERIKNFWNL